MALYYSSARDIWENSTVMNGGAKQFKKEATHPFDAGTSAMIASGELAADADAPGLFPVYFLCGVERRPSWDSQ